MIEELRKELVKLTTSDKDNGLERIDTPIDQLVVVIGSILGNSALSMIAIDRGDIKGAKDCIEQNALLSRDLAEISNISIDQIIDAIVQFNIERLNDPDE